MEKWARLIAAILALTLFVSISVARAAEQEYMGKVISIADGDTITILLPDKAQLKVRLAEIDAPERSQAFGDKSKKKISDLIFAKQVRILQVDKDRYGRVVGKVFFGDLDISHEMVRSGFAWVYDKYAKDEKLYELQDEARKQRKGLWSLPATEQVAPWEFRHMKKKRIISQSQDAPANDNIAPQNDNIRRGTEAR